MEDSGQRPENQQTDQRAYVYKSTLKNDYGFSEGWIKALGEPDKLVANPHYRSGPKSSLYLRERVETFIEDNAEAYARRLNERRNRSAAAFAAAKPRVRARRRKEDEIFRWALAVPIQLQDLPKDHATVVKMARKSFDELAIAREEPEAYDGALTPAGVLAFVRHEKTDYHYLLEEIEARPGAQAAYLVLKARINATICSRLGYDFEALDDGIWRWALEESQHPELLEALTA